MGIKVLQAPPTNLLTTLCRIKGELGITDESSDDLLFDILTRASMAVTRELGRPFLGLGVYEEWLKGSGSQLLGLRNTPLLGITSILEDGIPIIQTDPGQGYWIEDAEAGAIYRPCGWGQTVALLSWGWEAYASRYILPGGASTFRYTVTYIAGYLMPDQADYLPYDPTAGANPALIADPPPLPGSIEQACLETIKAWWLTRDRDYTITAAKVDNVQVTFAPSGVQTRSLPTVALGLLRNYRRVV